MNQVGGPVYRNVNDKETSLGISLKGIYISSVSSEWHSHEPKTYKSVPIMTKIFWLSWDMSQTTLIHFHLSVYSSSSLSFFYNQTHWLDSFLETQKNRKQRRRFYTSHNRPSTPQSTKGRTISKRSRINFSDSPWYLDARLEVETLKNVVPHSVATAFASNVLPVPGGPTIITP